MAYSVNVLVSGVLFMASLGCSGGSPSAAALTGDAAATSATDLLKPLSGLASGEKSQLFSTVGTWSFKRVVGLFAAGDSDLAVAVDGVALRDAKRVFLAHAPNILALGDRYQNLGSFWLAHGVMPAALSAPDFNAGLDALLHGVRGGNAAAVQRDLGVQAMLLALAAHGGGLGASHGEGLGLVGAAATCLPPQVLQSVRTAYKQAKRNGAHGVNVYVPLPNEPGRANVKYVIGKDNSVRKTYQLIGDDTDTEPRTAPIPDCEAEEISNEIDSASVDDLLLTVNRMALDATD